MLITTKTVISFTIPDEYQLLERFKAKHPDWIESVTTQYIGYEWQETYAVEAKEEDSECRKN